MPNWNPSGFMRNVVEQMRVIIAWEDNMVRQTLPLALATVIAFAPFGAHSDDKLVLKSRDRRPAV